MNTNKIILLLFFIAEINSAQNYYPLQVGNIWLYNSSSSSILSKELINGEEYYLRKVNSEYSRWESVDSSGSIIVRDLNGNQYTWLKLNEDAGSKWDTKEFRNGYYDDCTAELKSRNDSITFQDSVIYNCLNYIIKNLKTNKEIRLWLAPGIGILKTSVLNTNEEMLLIKARINNRRVPAKIIPPEIVYFYPSLNEIADISTYIELHFSFDMSKEVFDTGYIKISTKKKGLLNFKIDSHFAEIIIKPEYGLTFGDSVTVFISKFLTDNMGDNLQKDYYFTFYTEENKITGNLFIKDDLSKIPIFIEGAFDFGDYDSDGDKDLLILGSKQFSIWEYLPEGYLKRIELYKNVSGNFIREPVKVIPVFSGSDVSNDCIKWVDFNNDGSLDFVYSGQDSLNHGHIYFFENRKLTFTYREDLTLNASPGSIYWYDFNKDGYKELIFSDQSPDSKGIILYNFMSGRFIQDKVLSGYWVHLFDFNQDNQMDIISGEHDSLIFYENSKGKFFRTAFGISKDLINPFSDMEHNIESIDLDKDNDPDLQAGITTYYNNGNVFNEKRIQYQKPLLNAFIDFIDYDNDNVEELFLIGTYLSSPLGFSSFLNIYKIENGNFVKVRDVSLNRELFISSIRWVDLNGDNKKDLIIMSRYGFWIYYNSMLITNHNEHNLPLLKEYSLLQNYPNPFNPSTTITFSIPEAGMVSLKVYDILGQQIQVLLNEEKTPGTYKFTFDASSLPSGTYIYRINAGKYTSARKLLLLK